MVNENGGEDAVAVGGGDVGLFFVSDVDLGVF